MSLNGPLPDWAGELELKDHRGLIPWDSDQFIALVRMGDRLTSAVLDTGAGRSLIDLDPC